MITRILLAALLTIGPCASAARQANAAAPLSPCQYLSQSLDAVPAGAAFLASFPTVKSGPLNGTAFLYDNAVATIALVACAEPKRAARIGDAILAALANDRYWHDGRLRNGYRAGPVADGPLKLAGWWDTKLNKWVEDRYQVGSDTGNMAWAILALLALDHATGDRRYRDGAVRIGGWVNQWRSTTGPGGFTGGTFAHEPVPTVETWKSTEHNTDVAAAFTGLAQATGDDTWQTSAKAAEDLVRAMWRSECQCFAVGTARDGQTRNLYLALDAQTWPLLAIRGGATRYAGAIAPQKLRAGSGFAYGEAKQDLWTEGTAQVALLLELLGRRKEASDTMKALEAMRGPHGSYYAAASEQLPTGFMLETDPTQPRQYFHVEHLAAVAWVAIAQRRYNPFTRTRALAAD